MKVFKLLILFFYLSVFTLQAQTCNQSSIYNKWYFGFQGGLDFSGGGAPALITSSMIDATAGATSISNASGDVLFYSNGINVWDKNNNLMPNGTGLSGSPGYSQNSLAVPNASDGTKFYLFTNGASGLGYSIIDTTLNGGSGDVSSKNNSLFANTTEKLAGVADGNGNVWVVTHELNSNKFLAYKVTSAGVIQPAVISNTGTVQTGGSGTLKFSSDGTKAAIASASQNLIEVYDFDAATGLFSNPVTITESLAYDVEFSPDNSKLYSANSNGLELAQFDLSQGTSAAINASKVVLSNVSSTYYTALQLGPDGKIYVGLSKGVPAADGYIGVITDPNNTGMASNYLHRNIVMEPGTTSQYGLPNLIANTSVGSFTFTNPCFGSATQFSGTGYGDPATWTWDFNDPAPGVSTATGANPIHTFSTNNSSYNVSLSFTNACGTTTTVTKSVSITSLPIIVLKDTLVCDTPFVLTPSGTFGSNPAYLWSTSETSSSISSSNAGKYWVKVTNGGCSSADTNKVSVWGQGNHGDYNWLFGNKAGLNFNNNPATVITTNIFNTNEGSSSISDPTGHLLIYTDGVNVYNKNNAFMDGGTGLLGDVNSTQSALIVPDPRVNNLYYVFTVSAANGLNYSVVDLSYNNGLGKVTQTNIPLSSPTTEKLSGVKDDNGDFWVVSHGLGNDQFMAYKVGQSGLISTPVISTVGSVQNSGEGYLKFSQDGTKAVVANKGENYVEIFDFNKTTGAFTNPVKITNVTSPYGVEFSSDNSKLYVSTNGNGHLYQYDITSSNAPVVEATRTQINIDSTTTEYETIQMGPDGRIYIAIEGSSGTGYLDVINNPDLDSANLGYQHKIINLSGGISNAGLPNMVANYFTSSGWGIIYADTCNGMNTQFQGSAPDSVRTWTWDFGDGSPLVNSLSSPDKTFTVTRYRFPGPGTYHVKLIITYHCGIDTLKTDVTINAVPVVNISNHTACMASSYILDAGNPNASAWVWSNTAISSQTDTVSANGNYSVTVYNGACSATGNALITIVPPYSVNLGSDDTICSAPADSLDAGNTGATYNWYQEFNSIITPNPLHSRSISVTSPGKYWVDVLKSGCRATDTIQITVISPPVVNLGVDDSLCFGDTKRLDAGNPTFNYLWSTHETTDTINISMNNKYWVNVYKGSCSRSDTINFKFNPRPSVSLPSQIVFCSDNGPLNLYGGLANTYLWTPGGQTTDSIKVNSEGVYTLDAKTAQGCSTVVSTNVLNVCEAAIYVPSVFSPNADGSNDLFIIHGANISKYELQIFNQWGELIFVSTDMNNSWDGSYKGKVVPEGAYIWKISYEGETVTGLTKATKTGDVTVLR